MENPNLLFCLGREPHLSVAEILSYLRAEGVEAARVMQAGTVLRVEVQTPLDPVRTISRLGGTIKIAREVGKTDPEAPEESLVNLLASRLEEKARTTGRKVLFGVSDYRQRMHRSDGLKRLCGRVKEALGDQEISVRFVLPKEGTKLSSAQVEENDLPSRGGEFLLLDGGIVGQTEAVQPYERDAERDIGKPVRRLREGLLPPKIARIMVNLARTQETGNLLDPFCGSGVLLMEALELGLVPTGSDTNREAVEATRKNLEWLRSRSGRAGEGEFRVIQGDAGNLSNLLEPLSMDAVATEPYLGPPLKRALPASEASRLAQELRDLYVRALAEIRIVLRPGSRCVFITPILESTGGPVPVRIEKDLPFLGYEEISPFPSWGLPDPGPLVHRRPGQRVVRQIHVLRNP